MPRHVRSIKRPRVTFFSFQDIVTCITGILILVVVLMAIQLKDTHAAVTDPKLQALGQQRDDQRSKLEQLNQEIATLQKLIKDRGAAPDLGKVPKEGERLAGEVNRKSNALMSLEGELKKLKARQKEREAALGLDSLANEADSFEQETDALRKANGELDQKVAEAQQTYDRLKVIHHQVWLIPDSSGGNKQPVAVTISSKGIELQRLAPGETPVAVATDHVVPGFEQALAKFNSSREFVVFYIKPSGIGLYELCAPICRRQGFEVGYDALEEQQAIAFGERPAQ